MLMETNLIKASMLLFLNLMVVSSLFRTSLSYLSPCCALLPHVQCPWISSCLCHWFFSLLCFSPHYPLVLVILRVLSSAILSARHPLSLSTLILPLSWAQIRCWVQISLLSFSIAPWWHSVVQTLKSKVIVSSRISTSFYILLISISSDTHIRNLSVIPSSSFISCPIDHPLLVPLPFKISQIYLHLSILMPVTFVSILENSNSLLTSLSMSSLTLLLTFLTTTQLKCKLQLCEILQWPLYCFQGKPQTSYGIKGQNDFTPCTLPHHCLLLL